MIDINHHYQIKMNQHKNWTKKLNINICKVTFLLYHLLIFLNRFIIYLFRQRDCKKTFLHAGGSWLFFTSPAQWIGNEQLFKVGLSGLYSSLQSTTNHMQSTKSNALYGWHFFFFSVLIHLLQNKPICIWPIHG